MYYYQILIHKICLYYLQNIIDVGGNLVDDIKNNVKILTILRLHTLVKLY